MLSFSFHGRKHLLGRVLVKARIIEVKIGEDDPQEGFGFVEAGFERFDILRRRVTTTIRRLVVGTIYSQSVRMNEGDPRERGAED
jgi:hypothetical protein